MEQFAIPDLDLSSRKGIPLRIEVKDALFFGVREHFVDGVQKVVVFDFCHYPYFVIKSNGICQII